MTRSTVTRKFIPVGRVPSATRLIHQDVRKDHDPIIPKKITENATDFSLFSL